jgi:hypothetical protein
MGIMISRVVDRRGLFRSPTLSRKKFLSGNPVTPIFMNKMLALKFVLSIVSSHLIGQF